MERWAGILQPFFMEAFINQRLRISAWKDAHSWEDGKQQTFWYLWGLETWWAKTPVEDRGKEVSLLHSHFSPKDNCEFPKLHKVWDEKAKQKVSKMQTHCLDMLGREELEFRSHREMRSWWIPQALIWDSWSPGYKHNSFPKLLSSFDSVQSLTGVRYINPQPICPVKKRLTPWKKNTMGTSTILHLQYRELNKKLPGAPQDWTKWLKIKEKKIL